MDATGIFLLKRTVAGSGTGFDAAALIDMVRLFGSAPLPILGLALFLLAPLAMAYGLSRLDVSIAYPVQLGANFACVVALSVLVLNEPLSWTRGIGVVLIASGIWLMIASERREPM